MINNRQAGRRRGRGGQQQRSQGGNPGRPDNGNRIDNRARGNAAQLLEKYKALARDAQMQGDRVNVEYYLQFADHYFRVLAETRARLEENGGQAQGRRPQGATLDDDEQDYEDEGDRVAPHEQQRPDQGYRGAEERGGPQYGDTQYNGGSHAQRDERGNDGRSNDARGNDGRSSDTRGSDTRGSDTRGGDTRGGDTRGGDTRGGDTRGADGRGGDARTNEGRGREERNGNRINGNGAYREAEQPRRSDMRAEVRSESRPEPRSEPSAVEDVSAALVRDAAPVEAPKRGRGRPRRVPVEADAGDAPLLDAERLPPSLGLSAVVAHAVPTDDASAEDKPRRRRGRPPAAAAAD